MLPINEMAVELISRGAEINFQSDDARIVIIFGLLQIVTYFIRWVLDKKKVDANIDKTYSESDNIDAITIANLIESVGKLQEKSNEQHQVNNTLRLKILKMEKENRKLEEKMSDIEAENIRLSSVNNSNQKKIEALETENKDLRQIMTDAGLENKRIRDRLLRVTSGVRKLTKQIENIGYTPAFKLEDEQ